jgi:hypothetical protein
MISVKISKFEGLRNYDVVVLVLNTEPNFPFRLLITPSCVFQDRIDGTENPRWLRWMRESVYSYDMRRAKKIRGKFIVVSPLKSITYNSLF